MLRSLASSPSLPSTRRGTLASAAPVARKAAPRGAVLCRGSAPASGSASALTSRSDNSVVDVGSDAAATEAEKKGLACPLACPLLSSRSSRAPALSVPFFTHFERTRALPAQAACLALLRWTAGDTRALVLLPWALALAARKNAALVVLVAAVVAHQKGDRDAASRARALAAWRLLELALVVVFFATVARGVLPPGFVPPLPTAVIELRRLSASVASRSASSLSYSSSEPFLVVAVPSLVAKLLLQSSSSSSSSKFRGKVLLGAGNVVLSAACGIATLLAFSTLRWIASKVVKQREKEGEVAGVVVELVPRLPLLPPPSPPPPAPPSESLESQLRSELHKSKRDLSESRAQVEALAAELDLERRRQKKDEEDAAAAASSLDAAAAAAASSFAKSSPRSSSQPLLRVIREASRTLSQTRQELEASRARERAVEERAQRAEEEREEEKKKKKRKK